LIISISLTFLFPFVLKLIGFTFGGFEDPVIFFIALVVFAAAIVLVMYQRIGEQDDEIEDLMKRLGESDSKNEERFKIHDRLSNLETKLLFIEKRLKE